MYLQKIEDFRNKLKVFKLNDESDKIEINNRDMYKGCRKTQFCYKGCQNKITLYQPRGRR